MSRYMITCAIAAAMVVSIVAQTPTTPPTQTPSAAPVAAGQDQMPRVTVEGCLVREEDIGRRPNIVERQGIMEDYVLMTTRIVKGSSPGATQPAPDQPTGTAGTTSAMYHVKGLDDDRLKPLLGKRVQIAGTLQDLDKPTPASEDLPDLQASSIRQVSGDCPAAKP